MGAELALRLARAFGVEPETFAALLPDDAEPVELLRAAELIGRAIGERGAGAPAVVEPTWRALPARPGAPAHAHDRAAAIERQLAWARDAGASWNGIEFHVDASGNASVLASRKLASGESILTVPRHLMIVDNELVASTTGVPALGLPEPSPRDVLAAWLPLEAREPTSRWRPYLDGLPVQLDELPMFRDEDGRAALAGTAAHAVAADKNRDVHAAYGRLSPDLRARLSLADFAWGYALVMSRAFHAPGTLEHHIAMIPLVEILNHGLDDTTWSYHPSTGLVVSTEREFAIGEEVHFSYGARSNTHLIVHFGFALDNNTAREAGLIFERAADPAKVAAAHLMWNLPLEAAARIRVGCLLDDRFHRALSLARLQASGPIERARAMEVGLTSNRDLPWLGGTLEQAALAVLAAAARRALGELNAHCRPAPHRPWDQLCSVVRDSERAVLEDIIEFASIAGEHLHAPDPELLSAAADAIPGDAVGGLRLARRYLSSIAYELTV
jgi:protein-histidine N-methyltransferase